ncbi:trypsin CFT-1-like isoform X2 [Battus philenor]|uniref:trypsin CFT-1-like isoform X2 n=1 Tax=Battus philenor TaxID=42288 RepID=UPI0035D01CE1
MWLLLLAAGLAPCLAEQVNVNMAALNSSVGSRIIGGSPTVIEKHPYTVQIMFGTQLTCGGSLITKRHVLSAAHCFVDEKGTVFNPKNFRVRVGATFLNTGGTVHSVSTVIVHERYNRPVRDNDVAVVVLSTSVTISGSVNTTAIPPPGAALPDGATLVHIGWGRTDPSVSQASHVLNEVEVYKVNRSICQQRYLALQTVTGEPYPVTGNMICAGVLDVGGKDSCQGDSGGPLMYRDVVVGVTSWGYGCGQALFPGVSARVSAYTDWINTTVVRYNDGYRTSAGGLTLYLSIALKNATPV